MFPSAPKVSVLFQATESSPMHMRMPTQPFNLIIWGKMHAVAIIYWCRQESCLVPGAESCMPGRPWDAFIFVKGKGGGKVEASLPGWARKERIKTSMWSLNQLPTLTTPLHSGSGLPETQRGLVLWLSLVIVVVFNNSTRDCSS